MCVTLNQVEALLGAKDCLLRHTHKKGRANLHNPSASFTLLRATNHTCWHSLGACSRPADYPTRYVAEHTNCKRSSQPEQATHQV